jgi:hypothetical protein
MKKIIFFLFLLANLLVSVSYSKPISSDDSTLCKVFTKNILVNTERYLGKIKSKQRNPYQYYLYLKTNAISQDDRCMVEVQFQLKLTEFSTRKGDHGKRKRRICDENTSLLLKAKTVNTDLSRYIHKKINTCAAN